MIVCAVLSAKFSLSLRKSFLKFHMYALKVTDEFKNVAFFRNAKS